MKKTIVGLGALALLLSAMGGNSSRAETLRWFLENEYGVRPAAAESPKVEFSAAEPDRVMKDGSTRKCVKVTAHGPYGDFSFRFYAFIPKSAKPVPATVLLCNRPGAMPIDADSDVQTSVFWPRAEIIRRGYAAIAFYLSELASETYCPETALKSGVFPCYEKYEERTDRSWGVLSAWAWGASRVMDWMVLEPAIDATHALVVGHSRGGKCALVTGITDPRFAMVCPNDSGTGGARLNRMDVPKSEPWRSFGYFGVSYWFCGNYLKSIAPNNGRDVAHDQDEWLSLVAPRILSVGSAAADDWAGPAGECAATRKAMKTWWDAGVPENVQYGVREGGHDLNAIDWKRYLDFADARWRGATVTVKANDAADLQRALDDRRRPLTVVVPKGVYTVSKTLRIGGGTTLKAHPEARFVLDGSVEHHAGDFLLANADEQNGDRDITVEGGVWDGNKEVGFNVKVPQEKKFDPTSWSGCTLNFRNVKNLRLYDLTLANSVTFNARFCQVDGFDIRRIRIVSPVVKNNQDGLHFGGFCFNGVVDGVTVDTRGQTNDDLIALNADDSITRHENRGTVNGPITNVVIRNVYAEDCHCLVRLLRAYSDIRDVTIEKCAAGCRYNAINGDDAKKWMNVGFQAGAGEADVTAKSTGVLENVLIRDVTCWASVKNGFPLVKVDGELAGKGVQFDGFRRDWTKDVDPDRPTAANQETLFRMGADGLAHPPAWNAGKPKFNGPKVFGATPKRDFTYAFPVRGDRAGLAFSVAKGTLPAGARLDAKTGVLSGRVERAGDYAFTVKAQNVRGAAELAFTLKIGEGCRALTPQLGWTSWFAYLNDIRQETILQEAKAMVDTGLAARGYSFVNIDTGWQGDRTDWRKHGLEANPRRFPDMAKLVADIHALGLKAGIYSTPMLFAWGTDDWNLYRGSTTFPVDASEPGHHFGIGKRRCEAADASLWGAWGFDYLKYDWGKGTEPKFAVAMREALDATGRDFVLSLCTDCRVENAAEYAKVAQIVRGNGDTTDSWSSVTNLFRAHRAWADSVLPGFWYDLDMMVVGPMLAGDHGVVLGKKQVGNNLTHDEAAFHFVYWAFAANPIHLSCRLGEIDPFTLDLVSNEELLALLHDYPAAPASFAEPKGHDVVIGTRRLSDGRTAVAFFNLRDEFRTVRPLDGLPLELRDLLAGRDVKLDRQQGFCLPPHGVRVFAYGTTGAK